MAFNWTGTASTNHDTEGLTYLAGGVLVISEERLYDAYRFNHVAGGTATMANNFVSISDAVVGNKASKASAPIRVTAASSRSSNRLRRTSSPAH